jgi:CheY-like chemotaxis protein
VRSALIVDDEAGNIKLVSVLLHQAGWTVLAAYDPHEVRRLLRVVIPKVAIVGLRLERTGGLLHELSSLAVPLVVVMASDAPGTAQMARSAGCRAYVRAPIDVATFATTIARAERVEARP